MDRTLLVGQVFGVLAMGASPDTALGRQLAASDDPIAPGLQAVLDFWLGDFGGVSAHADRALASARTEEERCLALAVQSLGRAGDPAWDGADPIPEALEILARHPGEDRWWAAMRYLVAESALDCARLSEASQALATGPAPDAIWQGHPFALVMGACAVRISAFSGDILGATERIQALRGQPGEGLLHDVLDALSCLVLGNANDSSAITAIQQASRPATMRDDYLSRGRSFLQAYGAIALGDSATAAGCILEAGGDEGLRRCTIIDRVLGMELLAVAALDQGDVEAAEAWLLGADDVATNPIARPTLDRVEARIALAHGDLPTAIAWAEHSVLTCRETNRAVEAAESEIVLAQCQIAADEVAAAGRMLRVTVQASDLTGHHAVRRAASQTLATARRRLPPVAGGGWEALSPTETAVAHRILAGAEVDTIAGDLVISPHTVRVHVSRVLCAFGVASRIGLLASEAARGRAAGTTTAAERVLASLTVRQQDVARLVAVGTSNRLIADELGVSLKTVEKHVADIGHRWETATRFGIAQLWLASDYA